MHSLYSADWRWFCDRLIKARTSRGLTQKEAAKALGIPHSRLSRIESGQRRVDILELREFRKLYRRSLKYFEPPSS